MNGNALASLPALSLPLSALPLCASVCRCWVHASERAEEEQRERESERLLPFFPLSPLQKSQKQRSEREAISSSSGSVSIFLEFHFFWRTRILFSKPPPSSPLDLFESLLFLFPPETDRGRCVFVFAFEERSGIEQLGSERAQSIVIIFSVSLPSRQLLIPSPFKKKNSRNSQAQLHQNASNGAPGSACCRSPLPRGGGAAECEYKKKKADEKRETQSRRRRSSSFAARSAPPSRQRKNAFRPRPLPPLSFSKKKKKKNSPLARSTPTHHPPPPLKPKKQAIQSAEETALNAYSAFKNLQLGELKKRR